MSIQHRTVDILDVPFCGNRTLRLALYSAVDGTAEMLVMSLGWGTGGEWREDLQLTRGEGLALPVHALADLRAALAQSTKVEDDR